jgi:O-methyltransferase
VQDRPGVEGHFNATIPDDFKSRISFQPYDFFTPQTVKGAEVYFLKHILHDWSDQWATRILKQIVPVMGLNSTIMLMEGIVPPPGAVPDIAMKVVSGLDIQMLSGLNAKERTVEDWSALCKMTDEKLVVKNTIQIPGMAFAIIEIGSKQ